MKKEIHTHNKEERKTHIIRKKEILTHNKEERNPHT